MLHQSDTENDEAKFIAFEIKRCAANMGGVIRWGDFAVLRELTFDDFKFSYHFLTLFNGVRFNALSRPIENALQKEGIPCRILGGHKFFERMEVLCLASPSEYFFLTAHNRSKTFWHTYNL